MYSDANGHLEWMEKSQFSCPKVKSNNSFRFSPQPFTIIKHESDEIYIVSHKEQNFINIKDTERS